MCDRDRKISKDNFGRKRKSTGFIYLPGSYFREAEGHLSISSCLQDAVINYAPRVRRYIDKQEFYRQCPPRKVKDTNISEVENTSCVRNFMKVTPVSGKKIEPWGAACILRRVNYGVLIFTCNFQSDEYNCCTKHAFVYDSHFKHLHQSGCCGVLIDNIADAPICVLEDKYRATKKH